MGKEKEKFVESVSKFEIGLMVVLEELEKEIKKIKNSSEVKLAREILLSQKK